MTTWLTRAGNGNILDRIGDTPLLRLARVAAAGDGVPDGVEVHAKAEHLNPSGSVKDRAALAMTIEGLRSGALAPGKTILDASSGNTGIAYAMIGAALGYPGHHLPAVQRQPRAQADPADPRLPRSSTPTRCRAPTARSRKPGDSSRRRPTATSIPTSTTTRPTGARTSSTPASRSGSRPAGV